MEIALLALLIAINAIFVMSEMALVSSKRGRLEAQLARGSAGAAAALYLLDHPTRYLSTVQIGITLTGILAGAIGESAIADRLIPVLGEWGLQSSSARAISLGVTVLLITLVTLVAGELVPKRLALAYAEPIASILAIPMRWLSVACAPLVWVLSVSTDLVMKVIPARKQAEGEAEAEVKAILKSGEAKGEFGKAERQIVERVLELGDQRVRQVMVPRNDIDWLDVREGAQRLRVAVATSSHSHFPICDGDLDHLIGVVHIKDLVKNSLITEEIDMRALCRKPLFVPDAAPAIRVLDRFKRSGQHIAFVIDEYGVLVGLITLNDLVESLLGDVAISGGPPDPQVVKRADGSYLLDGMLPTSELRTLMGVESLPKEGQADFDTLGGFVMTYMGRVPATGDRFEFDRFTFEIMDMDRTRVDRVLLSMEAPKAADSER